MHGRRRRLLAPVVAAWFLVSACSGDDEDGPKPLAPLTEASPATPSASPSPSGPTAASAESFVRRYYKALNDATLVGRVNNLPRLVLRSCTRCASDISYLRQLERERLHQEAVQVLVLDVKTASVETNSATVQTLLEAKRARLLDVNGRAVDSVVGRRPFRERFTLVFSDHRWLVQSIEEYK